MLSLIFALALADPTAAAPPEAPPPVVEKARYSKAQKVTCKWVTNSGGIAQRVCMTGHAWRNEQIERQRNVDDFQRRALTVGPR